ncbi:MAG: lipid-A-disaccharide synthase [Pseudomonadota bacterium]
MSLFYLVAGEPSGDRLGASLMRGLKHLAPESTFAGVGGPLMRAEGLASLFDYRDLAVMGIAEVLPRLPQLVARIRETANDCLERRPAALIGIDAPSFALRVSERVRRRDPRIRTIHYVAPSVWAWRPGRAAHMARFTDHVLALLPFEPPYMQAAGMTCDFVGHPIAETKALPKAEIAATRARLGGDRPLLAVAPGSRRSEIARMAPLFTETLARLRTQIPDLACVLPLSDAVAGALPESLAQGATLVRPEDGEHAKRLAFGAADAALVKSGTISLEMAAADTPHIVTYQTSWLTAAIVRRLVRIDTANLVNLVSESRTVPEYLQERATPKALAAAVSGLLEDANTRAAQRRVFDQVLQTLGRGGEAPSLRAARSVLAQV